MEHGAFVGVPIHYFAIDKGSKVKHVFMWRCEECNHVYGVGGFDKFLTKIKLETEIVKDWNKHLDEQLSKENI